ncbi:uncharacterized protein F5Z01DRAFT_627301 [Emericellopsis atlantica]|uniref:T6SS Phospholipase effector Tle1-like catalytic domain-containing protein n=1 Tax=Emericellopsis atlantica TaxID=2614577 RepID=A0A9P7ZG73_9HYPO|nr:uncharacterized protein F5Z01DRAFT_627301 [Emericellopsis atlantica]KAG9251514.1 hypothetical protein F5Z01DRAFT_627301 [Emericellopsis atlantica]
MATKGSTQHAGSASAANILTDSNQDAINTNSNAAQAAASRGVRKLVLCFDGTGNKFHGDDSDSNILKIFRMLDRTADDQYHYYQPGIGTYVVSGSLSHTSVRARFNSWYTKAKDSAVGSSFDQHVVGGYRFLMRFYNPGDEIYLFGFSRGSYIARFLAEMLDYIGLLSHGNEEMVKFAWKAFAQWQCRQQSVGSAEEIRKADEEKRKMYKFMKGFRETFSRPVGRIKFLGLFDTVNSVPRFETAWMQRSKFPYTAKSSAKVIRHAVSIDERRAKFRQDLMYQGNRKVREHHKRHNMEKWSKDKYLSPNDPQASSQTRPLEEKPAQQGVEDDFAPYRARSSSRRPQSAQSAAPSEISNSNPPPSEIQPVDDSGQDIDEVWFAGGHADVGGGWEMLEDSKSASHVPLTWMVREAMRAGLPFDPDKVAELGCACSNEWSADNPAKKPAALRKKGKNRQTTAGDIPAIRMENGGTPTFPESPSEYRHRSPREPRPATASSTASSASSCSTDEDERHFHGLMGRAHTARIHDSLAYHGGLNHFSVTGWKLMEYLPFRRMDLKSDGTWEPIRWPLPRGEVRDIPDDVRVHGSVIRRMKEDENYRPGNLIIGGGGRGVRHAPKEYGIGEWVCVADEGDPVGEIWMKKDKCE